MFFFRRRLPAEPENNKAPPKALPDFKARAGRIRQPDQVLDAKTGHTLLIAAVLKNDHVAVEKLLESLANPNKPDASGQTALHHAARQGDEGLVRLLWENGANMNAQDHDGRTPLHASVENKAGLPAVRICS